ncbi:MAG: DEAD/DEAH box helicase [Myxococcota bacterium]|nr:DEAD/DEAH box helicase [Myxococcota bacterium]
MAELSELFAACAEDIQAAIRDLGWADPMPVQSKTIPLMREGHDLIVQARTGSGKTGAFGIPIVEAVDCDLAETQALVMLPTRELANQVALELSALGRHRGVRVLPIYGGVGYGAQLEGLEAGAHVVVGTPGRVLDHLGSSRMHLDHVKILILDEADEMLSLGFWPDMREIRSYLPTEGRSSYLFSATMPEKVRSLARFFLNDEQFVTLSEGQVAPQEIEHFFYVCTAQEKENVLARVIEYEDPESAIIFCNTKADVRYVTSFLQKREIDADQISGDLNQAAREQAIRRIKAGELRFLVATDVAARGLDISDLSHVISYAAPESPEVYVHRTGRTGRAGKSGIALSLVSGLDIGNFKYLENVTKISITERKPPTEKDITIRIRERLEVKIEQEMRHMSPTQRDLHVDRMVPIVDELSNSAEGRRDLAAIAAAYLVEHRPETTVTEGELIADDAASESSDGSTRKADERREDRPRPRRGRGGGGRGGGGRGGGGRGGGGGGGGGGGRNRR